MLHRPNLPSERTTRIRRRSSAWMKVGIPVSRSYKDVQKLDFVTCGTIWQVWDFQVNCRNVRQAVIVCIQG